MRLLIPLLAALFMGSAAPCQAEISEYDIEIVIFEDLSSRYINSEQWPRVEHTLPLEESTPDLLMEELLEPASPDYPDDNDVINIASNNNVMLDKYVKKLGSSARYKVLVHKSWRQAGLDVGSAIDIEIDSRKDQHNSGGPDALQGIDANMPDPAKGHGAELTSSVSGKVKVTLGRYLHIYTDLLYKKPASFQTPIPVSLEDSRFSEFQIKSHRRMRSKELHYLDHPLLGILVMALPVESIEKDAQQQTPTQ